MSEFNLFKIAAIRGANAVVTDGDNIYTCSYEDGAVHVVGPSVRSVIQTDKLSYYCLMNTQCAVIDGNTYVVTNRNEGRFTAVSLYKNNIFIEQWKFICVRYYQCHGRGSLLGYYAYFNNISEFSIVDDKIARHVVCNDNELPHHSNGIENIVSDDKYVYCVFRCFICRYNRFKRQTSRINLPVADRSNTIGISKCAKYITFVQGDRFQIIETRNIDFKRGVFTGGVSYASSLLLCVPVPEEIIIEGKLYIITHISKQQTDLINRLYELRKGGKQYKTDGNVLYHTYLCRKGGIIWCVESDNEIGVYNFTWNRQYLYLQSSKIKRTVMIIILLLRRVCPHFPRDLVMLIVDTVMRNQ